MRRQRQYTGECEVQLAAMGEMVLQWLQIGGTWAGWMLVWLLCLAGLGLSAVSLFGTWCVVAATALALFLSPGPFPNAVTLILFAALAGLIELAEWAAGAWGVQRRGGSGWAGGAALVGGLVGLFLGTALPVPVIGSLLGMLVGSFGCAFAVERYRLKHSGQAAHIAWGAVVARLLVILLKVAATLGMTVVLIVGLVAT